ncbi:t-cell surface glycoprotein cd3 delta chain [Limosa lapponica baueri]|uniref:T-cell surface glycoprotein cd3 delta chain n=1 Tax=Limosa lapponica baueri TaxID=1758121 RepID=A0A2I0TV38_LIMLA|nr:t-cell surface glycoprotein cd3 delta chain [Limosa lapponica baueri]
MAGARRQAQGTSDTPRLLWEGAPAPGIRYLTKISGCVVARSSLRVLSPEQEKELPPLCAMRRGRALGAWVLLASLAVASWGVQGQQIIVKEASGKVFLHCVTNEVGVTWWRDGITVGNTTQLDLGTIYDDPRGTYICETSTKASLPLQVHYRMCQNCIEVDAPTISGIVVADVIATVFLAVAVYCITGQDKGRMSRASDRQNLIANEQLYQPLGERDDGQYSRLTPAKARK